MLKQPKNHVAVFYPDCSYAIPFIKTVFMKRTGVLYQCATPCYGMNHESHEMNMERNGMNMKRGWNEHGTRNECG